jgi:two-component system phosphate regulon response regulator PhoB
VPFSTDAARRATGRLFPGGILSVSAYRILVVEDDRSLADVLAYNLRAAGFESRIEVDGNRGLAAAREQSPDLILLDLMLPGIDGLEVCRRLRSDPITRSVLVMMLTAKSEEMDQIIGFAVGADDYVTKPFSVKVVLERVKALLRRRETSVEQQEVVVNQGVLVDRRRHVASAGNEELPLTPSEFSLLDALIRQPGRAFTRQDLIDAALGDDAIVLERTIDVHVRSLRKKLGPFADLVETVRGIGYRFRDAREAE